MSNKIVNTKSKSEGEKMDYILTFLIAEFYIFNFFWTKYNFL